MRAKKIFHVLVGFWFASILFMGGSALYVWVAGIFDRSSGNDSVFSFFPRFAMIASAAVPLAVGVFMWPSRRYVSMGILIFGAAAFLYWLAQGRIT